MAKKEKTAKAVTWERRRFQDSALQDVKKEAVASLLYEILMRKEVPSIEHKVMASELNPALKSLFQESRLHLHFVAFPGDCWEALFAMGDEGMIEVHADGDDEDWLRLVPGSVLADMIKAAIDENLAARTT